jgi:pullulanase
VLQASGVQVAGALDDLFATAEGMPDLGATVTKRGTQFKLWAPTAQRVSLCLHANGQAPAQRLLPLKHDARSGVWSLRQRQDLTGRYYTYLVDVLVPGVGLVRNRVTDPYALSLASNSRRTWIGRLDHPALKPAGWETTHAPNDGESGHRRGDLRTACARFFRQRHQRATGLARQVPGLY